MLKAMEMKWIWREKRKNSRRLKLKGVFKLYVWAFYQWLHQFDWFLFFLLFFNWSDRTTAHTLMYHRRYCTFIIIFENLILYIKHMYLPKATDNFFIRIHVYSNQNGKNENVFLFSATIVASLYGNCCNKLYLNFHFNGNSNRNFVIFFSRTACKSESTVKMVFS